MEDSGCSKLLLLLLLLLCVFLGSTGALPAGGAAEDLNSRIRGLWRLQMKETQSKGKAPPPPAHPNMAAGRKQLLYCRVGIGYHLEIVPDGRVRGVHLPTPHCYLRVFAMKHGVVGIRGVTAGRYLCMKADGVVYGSESFSDDCLFRENLEENLYTTYSSRSHPGLYLALSNQGEVKRGTRVSRHQARTHFLPRRVP